MNNIWSFVSEHPRELVVVALFGISVFIISLILVFDSKKTYRESDEMQKDANEKYSESIKARENAIKSLESASKLADQYKSMLDETKRKHEESERFMIRAEQYRREAKENLENAENILKQSEQLRAGAVNAISSAYNPDGIISSSLLNFCKMITESITKDDGGDGDAGN